jgi:hypothetical protein
MKKDCFGNQIVEMDYVGHFTMLMIQRTWFNSSSSHAL